MFFGMLSGCYLVRVPKPKGNPALHAFAHFECKYVQPAAVCWRDEHKRTRKRGRLTNMSGEALTAYFVHPVSSIL